MFLSSLLVTVFFMLSVTPAVAADIQAAYGKISDDLLAEFDAVRSGDKLSVVVWLEDNTTEEFQSKASEVALPKSIAEDNNGNEVRNKQLLTEEQKLAQIEEIQNYIMQKRRIAQAMYLSDNKEIVSNLSSKLSGGKVVYVSKYSPLIVCEISRSEAVNMAMNKEVLKMTSGETKIEPLMSVSRNVVSANVMQDTYGITGQGIKIGMIETGVPDTSYECFDGIENKITSRSGAVMRSHASTVAAIMVGKDTGIAKGFQHLYCTASSTLGGLYSNVEWLLDQGVNVINFSFHNGANTSYSDDANWLDHIAYNHSVHCVIASGNDGPDKVSDLGMAYNVITVGAIDDNNTVGCTDDNRMYELIIEDGETVEMSTAYNRTKLGANKPDISAPGVSIDIPNTTLTDNTGTSFAAPHVSGIVAMLCSYEPVLLTKQALMKSILLTSVSNQNHRYDTTDVNISSYRQYGGGIVNAYNAKCLIDSGNYVNSSITASQTYKTYSIGTVQQGETISVSLSYLMRTRIISDDHVNDPSISYNLLSDLNIYIRPASAPAYYTPYAVSITSGNNVEKIVFTAPETDEYNVMVYKKTGQDPYEIIFALSWLKDFAGMH